MEDRVILELKCVERIQRIHEAQLLTYLRLAGKEVGLLFNFHSNVLTRGGVVRKVLQPEVLRASASPR